MKFAKFKNQLICSVLCGIAAISLASCSDTITYTPSNAFYFSDDAGSTYRSGKVEYEVGENVYMRLYVKVESTNEKQEEVGVVVTIPYIKDVVTKYATGQIVTPEVDEINHTSTYNFTVISSTSPNDFTFDFQFVPVKATDVTMTITYDDKISSIYDQQKTIYFVDKTTDGATDNTSTSSEE